jgi:hypothetical protein
MISRTEAAPQWHLMAMSAGVRSPALTDDRTPPGVKENRSGSAVLRSEMRNVVW